MSLATPPQADDLEVSLFGPGLGECVVLHIGRGDWIVVDSCIDRATGNPVALDYLKQIGVDPASAIRLVIVTHWHDDHMRGISEVLRAASGARFACSAALRTSEFKQFIVASDEMMARSGVNEFASIMSILRDRRLSKTRVDAVGPTWVIADQMLYNQRNGSGEQAGQVYALSPSPATVTRGFRELGQILPKVGMAKRAAVSVEPNDTAVVLSVRLGARHAILGADLETGHGPSTGWRAVLDCVCLPSTRAELLKVPHHGSGNAYHKPVWETALTNTAIAVLTPFSRGRVSLPTLNDIQRLKSHTSEVHCTASATSKAAFADPMVAKTMRETAKSVRSRQGAMGHVRVRLRQSGGRTVEHFGTAFAA